MQKPLISIIVPVYNAESSLEKCLSSLIKQSYSNIEIIVVNDGSTDDSARICLCFASLDTRIKVYNQENGGRSVARNKGLSAARGLFVGFVDSDDWVDNDMFETLYNAHNQSGADIVQCSYYYHQGDLVKEVSRSSEQLLSKEQALELLFEDKVIKNFLWNNLFVKELFNGISFPTGRNFEDVFVTYQLFARARSVFCLSQAKYHYCMSATSIVHSAFSVKDKFDYLDAINNQYRFAQTLGLWERSSVLLTRKYLSILDECIRHKVGQGYINLLSEYLRENVSSKSLFKYAKYLFFRRFLFLRVRPLYVFLTR
ncbi:glycosyltransferase [Bacteroides sp.]|uniref:glycosyltransferase n=1 Tax=Bacteroides sp. TaxID=29523 RepID=UPI001B54818B|nr:glycosyltransferase [Bacteroides sp.]MBP6064540.1 glycosyltransferase [Bacteroides sp.]MBP6066701.1 glycosyltransferase [Bacteroides sp.]MBP6935463.1 glycosyltransferase [Bacteroides sp.]MBP9585343.1 glycosyltransferase [Bacteroides sp.]